jgi:hypothetical protein
MKFRIENQIDREFGMVPRSLWKMDLPFAAKALAAYLFCLRDGAVPYVAEIEAETGLGRDARRKAFAHLEAAGLIRWQVEKTVRGVICGKTLLLNASACRAPENQADGETHHAPENPAGGLSVDVSTGNRLNSDCGSGDTLKEKKIKGAAIARAAAARRGPVARSMAGGSVPAVSDLSEFQRCRVMSGQSVLVGGVLLPASSPEMQALRSALRLQSA